MLELIFNQMLNVLKGVGFCERRMLQLVALRLPLLGWIRTLDRRFVQRSGQLLGRFLAVGLKNGPRGSNELGLL